MVGGNPRDGRLTRKWIVKGENPAPRHFNSEKYSAGAAQSGATIKFCLNGESAGNGSD
jgi:hypothetical protein